MNEVEFRGEVDVGFIEGNEEYGEDLVDFDKEEVGFLIEFCGWLVPCFRWWAM